ncbi:MAG: FtsX-like permease family protein, partial [Acidobacteriia bacterium]|nr:FtsX-like permease family protein [Terriglobia bacterium]
GNPRALASAIESEIHALDKDMPIADVRSMDEYVSDSVAAPRFNTILLTAFAALALVLSSVGIFGVIAYSVGQRTQEIGIRRALGADSASVMRMVVGQGLVLAVIGILTGVGGALTVTRVLTTLLFEVTPSDPLTFAAVATVLAVVALAASYLPARRASRIDPMEALRRD